MTDFVIKVDGAPVATSTPEMRIDLPITSSPQPKVHTRFAIKHGYGWISETGYSKYTRPELYGYEEAKEHAKEIRAGKGGCYDEYWATTEVKLEMTVFVTALPNGAVMQLTQIIETL